MCNVGTTDDDESRQKSPKSGVTGQSSFIFVLCMFLLEQAAFLVNSSDKSSYISLISHVQCPFKSACFLMYTFNICVGMTPIMCMI